MGFGDQIKQFADKANAKLDAAAQQIEASAKQQLVELFGEDAAQIKSIQFDADAGKFHQVEAPAFISDRLRQEGLLKE